MRRRLGCLSRSGIVAALVILAVLAVLGLLLGGRPFSPGPLNDQAGDLALGGVRSHAETGGRCAACHPAPWSGETMADRCLACHADVGLQLQDAGSLHGALLAGEPTVACRPCHTDHRGAEALLTSLDPDTFPHEATGYSLQGHGELGPDRPFGCADCHGLDLTRL